MPTYKQWILPSVQTDQGSIEIRINQGQLGYSVPATDTIALDPTSQIITGIGSIKRAMNNEDGLLTCDQIDISVRDRFTYTGMSNGVAVGEDLGELSTTLLGKIFSEEYDVFGNPFLYEIWFSHTNDHGTERFFVGDFCPLNAPFDHQVIHKPHTANEQVFQTSKVTVNFAIERLKTRKISDLYDIIAADPTTYTALGHMIGGNVYDPFVNPVETSSPATMLYDADGLDTNSNTFPHGLRGIRVHDLLFAIAECIGLSTGNITDENSSFRFYWQKWNGHNYEIQDYVDPNNHWVSFNYLFGKPVTNTDDFVWPNTFDSTKPLSDLLKSICYQYGVVVSMSFITNTPKITYIGRRQNVGLLPTNFVLLEGSKEEPRQQKLSRVAAKNRGDDDKVIAGFRSLKDTIDVEIAWRVHKYGEPVGDYSSDGKASVKSDARTWDTKLANYANKTRCLLTKADEDGHLTGTSEVDPDGWLLGSMLYQRFTSNPSIFHYASGHGSDTGFYSLAMVLAKEWEVPTNADGDGYFNSTKAYAQWYYEELSGVRSIVSRKYKGCLGDDGLVASVTVGIQTSFRLRGSVRTFRAVEIEQDLINFTTIIKWLEVFPSDLLVLRPPVYVEGQSGTTSSGGASTGSASSEPTSGSVTGTFLAKLPTISTTNMIVPQAINVVPISTKTIVSQTANNYELYNTTGTTVLTKIATDGKIHTPATVDGDSADTLTTKDWVLGKISSPASDVVKTDPATSATNKIQPTASSAIAVTIQGHTSQTAHLVSLNDRSGTETSYFDRDGVFTTNADISVGGNIHAGGDVTGTNLGLSGNAHAGVSTTSGDTSLTLTTKDYVDTSVSALGSVYVKLNPASSSTNQLKATSTSTTNLRLQGNTSGTAQTVLTLEDNTTVKTVFDSFGRAGFGYSSISSPLDPQVSVKSKDDTITPLAVTQGISNSGSASIFQVNNNASSTVAEVTSAGEMKLSMGFSTGNVTTISSNTTLNASAAVWRLNASGGAFTATLPLASTCKGRIYYLLRTNAGGNTVTIGRSTNGTTGVTDTIKGGAANQTLGGQWVALTVISDGGTDWMVF